MRSVAGEALRQIHSVAHWAAVCGVKPRTIEQWISGSKSPSDTNAKAIESAGGPPAAGWRELYVPPAPARRPAAADGTPERVDAEKTSRLADAIYADAIALREEMAMAPDGDQGQRLRKLADLAKITTELGRLTGVGIVLSERQILASPNFERIMVALESALTPWPDAMRACADAIENLRGGNRREKA